MPRAVPIVRTVLMVLSLACSAAPAEAIDSHRAITQALLRKWQIQQGLPQPTITVVTQTSDGTLWLGTQSGLYQFDGVRFDAALVIEGQSLDGVWVNDLKEDRHGNLWIATRGEGLFTLRNGNVIRHGTPVGFPMRTANCLLIDRTGELWVGGEGGVAHYHDSTFHRYDKADGLGISNVRAMAEAEDGTIWIGGDGAGLSQRKNGTFQDHGGLPDRVVQTLLADRRGGIWAGTNRGLLRIRDRQESWLTTADGLADDAVECLACTRDGTLWVGTRNGLCRWNEEEKIECFRTRDGLTQSTVLTICEDHEGSLWVGTKHGLNQFTDRRTLPLTMTEGLPTNDAGPVAQDGGGKVWIGTLGEGVALYDGRRCVLAISTANGLPGNRVLSLAAGENSDLWVGTDKGLCLVRDQQSVKHLTTAEGLPSDEVTCLVRDGSGTLWVGTSRGVARLEGNTLVRPIDDPTLATAAVFALLNAGDQGLVAATSEGVFRILGGMTLKFPGDDAWLSNVHALALGREGDFWLASRGRGLLWISGERVSRFTVADGLFDDEIVGISEDENGSVWMGCSRGIFSVTRQELLKYAAGELRSLNCWSLSPTDAMRTVECQREVQPAVARTSDGALWFSTIHGIIVVDPQNIVRRLPKPLVDVTQMQVNGRWTATHEPLTLPPGPLNLSIRYTAHSYASPTRTMFRYRLEGFDNDWIEAGSRREAFYTNLPPGTYRFHVSAANPEEPWTDADSTVQLTLTPSFWQTRWFPILAAMLTIGSVWLFLRLRVLRVRARLNAIVAERSRIARELHDTLIQGFSGVTMQMQAVSTRLNDPSVREAIDEVIADAGACLREARQSVAGLRSSQGTSMSLPAAIEQAARQLTETREVRLHLELPSAAPVLPVEVEFNLLRIAQEAITNAARHAHARTIDVSLQQQQGRLALRVHDDGVGFAVAEKEQLDHRHFGLIGMRERSRQISADLSIDSRPGAGTTILVDLPLAAGDNPAFNNPPTPGTHRKES